MTIMSISNFSRLLGVLRQEQPYYIKVNNNYFDKSLPVHTRLTVTNAGAIDPLDLS